MSLKLNSAAGGSVTISEPSTASNFNITVPAASGNVVLNPVIAGTTSQAPIIFTPGTNLTTPYTGAMEYDGEALFFTPISTQRGIVPSPQYYVLNTNLAGLNATSAQSILGVGVSLAANTIYRFQMQWLPFKTAGTTSHTMALQFGGTATLNWINYTARWNATTAYNIQSAGGAFQGANTTSAVIITSARTSAGEYGCVWTQGTISVNSAGTFIPQYALSAAPGGAYTSLAGSWFEIYPIAVSGANVSIGTWS